MTKIRLTLFALGVSTMYPRQFQFKIKRWKMIFLWAVSLVIPEIYPKACKSKFSNFGPSTSPQMKSSNLWPFSHGQTHKNWKRSNFFRNHFRHKEHFYEWKTFVIRKLQFLKNVLDFPNCSENSDIGPFLSHTFQ